MRPLVIRANVGDTVQINFENKQNRRASIHVQGLSYNVLTSDGTDVGYNPDSTTGRCICYTWQADQEGVFLFAHNGIRLLDKDGNLIKTTEQGLEDGEAGGHEDTGEKGFNYRSERFFNRLQRLPIISKVFDSKVHGDPATPVFRSYPGERVIIRLLMPADKPRNISFALHGHRWRAQPDDPFTRIIPVQGAVSVGNVFNIEPERATCPGDYLYRSGSLRWDVESGMWGIYRVLSRSIRYCCETACRGVKQWWEKKWYEK